MQGRDRRIGGSWLVPSLRIGLPVALAAGAAVLLALLVSQDAAIVVAPMVTILAVALLVGRAAAQRRRQMGRVRRQLSRRLDLLDRRQARQGRRTRREADRLYGRIEALTALRDVLHGAIVVPSTTDWAASADLLRELAMIVMARRPRVVVETGSGTSTVVIAGCLERLGDGHVWSLEHLPSFARETQDRLAVSGLEDRATIVDAPLVDVRLGEGTWRWYDLSALPPTDPIGLLLVDGPPGDTGPLARYPALPMLLDRLAPDAAILIDDAARPDEREMVARWCAEVPGIGVRELRLEKGGTLLTLGAATPTTG
ncbi:MAG: class I SAM-dependent methyltransferase [Candidatus Limnocylindrales bacterium]